MGASAKDERDDRELAAAIERAWVARFGKVAVVCESTLAAIRRGDPPPVAPSERPCSCCANRPARSER